MRNDIKNNENLKPIIEVRNIGKKYNITHQRGGYVALRDVMMNIIKSPFSFLKTKAKQVTGFEKKEEFWALRDISFTVNKGEVVGIIGANGAGKSTLLKILSQITPPAEGEINIRGRVGSLLEVGTGFHPELSGRENIFLNGAILGMKRREIAKKFDEIVEFAGIGKFLDTPVKYYSSGMYVRLAFSVAAHMEPEILIVDEVLAVGDAEFQKKCMGKMDEITKSHGRTILFVSHNMAAVQNLCTRSILLEHGKIVKTGKTSDIVSYYLSDRIKRSELSITPKNSEVGVTKAWFEDERGEKVSSTEMGENIYLKLEYITKKEIPVMDIGCVIYKEGVAIFGSHRSDFKNEFERSVKPGAYLSSVKLPTSILKEGIYTLKIIIGTDRNVSDPNASMKFEITNTLVDTTSKSYHPEREGLLYTNLEWKTERISST